MTEKQKAQIIRRANLNMFDRDVPPAPAASLANVRIGFKARREIRRIL